MNPKLVASVPFSVSVFQIGHILERSPNVAGLIIYKLPGATRKMNVQKQEKTHLEKHQLYFVIFGSVAVRDKFF
jgi:hypothetical protein